MQTKHIGFALLAVLVLATAWFVVGGLLQDPVQPAKTAKAGVEGAAEEGEPGRAGEAPIVRREEGLSGDKAAEPQANLALPGALPKLAVPAGEAPAVAPHTPHGPIELEGELQETDAEQAIRAVFPAIRDCYTELRQRAPQAKGRMLMKFAVRPATETGQASLGELFLKETQFTDPKYLTCVRAAIDATKFPVRGNVNGSVTVPLILSPEDAGQPSP